MTSPGMAVSPAKPAVVDDPALPAGPETHDENELRSAIGAAPLKDYDDDDDGEPRRRRSSRAILIAALLAICVGGAGALVLFGYLNNARYVLACEPARAVAEQGRSVPPWGTRALAGDAWRPLKIAPETRCRPLETDEPLVLERAFLAMVLDQVTALLTAREVTRVDDAQALLDQALLLTRPPEHEPEPLAKQRTDQHQEIERLLGDVAYWRAAAKVRDAAAALGDAAKQYDAAAAQHPRHVSDAAAWAAHTRRLAQDLRAGPVGAARPAGAAAPASSAAGQPPAPAGAAASAAGQSPSASEPSAPASPGDHPGVPTGIALPVEPDKPGAPPPAAAPPAAGAPTGGVLL